MDGFTMLALIVYVVANISIASLKVKGYIKMIGFFSLLVLGLIFAGDLSAQVPNPEFLYVVFALIPLVLFLGDVLFNWKRG